MRRYTNYNGLRGALQALFLMCGGFAAKPKNNGGMLDNGNIVKYNYKNKSVNEELCGSV